MHTVKRILRPIFLPLIAAVLLFEEWGWAPLAAAFARLARIPLWAWLEQKIRRLPPMWALLAFGVPMLLLLPVKLLALYLFGQGQATMGLFLLVAAKLGGTALLARLFQLTQPALMQLDWFARWYPRWMAWKERVLAEIRQSLVWRAGQRSKRRVKAWLRGFSR